MPSLRRSLLAWSLGLGSSMLSLEAEAMAQRDPVIGHQADDCWPEDQFPELAAKIQPGEEILKAKVYFRSDKYPDFYYVEMAAKPSAEDFLAILPKPGPETERVIYYLEAIDSTFNGARTEEYDPEVEDPCKRRDPAAYTGTDPGIVVGATKAGAAAVPPGFQAAGIVGFITAAGVGTAAGSGLGIGTAVAVAGVAAGAAGAVVVAGGEATTTIPPTAGPPSTTSVLTGGATTTTVAPATTTTTGTTTSTTSVPGATTTVPSTTTVGPTTSSSSTSTTTTTPSTTPHHRFYDDEFQHHDDDRRSAGDRVLYGHQAELLRLALRRLLLDRPHRAVQLDDRSRRQHAGAASAGQSLRAGRRRKLEPTCPRRLQRGSVDLGPVDGRRVRRPDGFGGSGSENRPQSRSPSG